MKNLNKLVCFLVILGIFLSYFLSPLSFFIDTRRVNLLDAFYFPMILFSNFYDYLGAVFNIKEMIAHNKELHKRVSVLQLQVSNLENLKRENNELRDFLNLEKKTTLKHICAEVIAKERKDFSKSVILDKGNNSGISLDVFVFTGEGLVGRVKEVGKKTSKVILVTDINFKVEAKVQSTNDIGLLTGGERDNTCYMNYLPKASDVKKGDLVVTSGNSKFLPEGIPIGRIRVVIPSEGSFFKKAILDSCIDFRKIKFVLCLTNN